MEVLGLILGFVAFIGMISTSGLCIYSIYNIKFKYRPKQLLMVLIVFSMALVISSEILLADSNKQNKSNKTNIEESSKRIK
ncbi:hypothetical protein UT300005_05940 [Clostridium sp. CTA-5]